jgi:NAD(P)-dependent dehydrogenase (short-subunit alcohol dehydrogenase family)
MDPALFCLGRPRPAAGITEGVTTDEELEMSTEPTREAAGRVWLITGASSGFGRSIAEAALAAGDTVVATARRPESLDDLVAAYPDRAVAAALDVTDSARIAAVVAEVILWYGRVDVLVNNAGRGHLGAVEETTDQELRELMDLHFFGPATLTRAVLPHMRRQGSGAIVQMSSMGGRFSFPGVGAYSATKFALEGLSQALAQEVVPFGIKVLIVEPGSFRTGLAGASHTQSPEIPAYKPTVGAFRTDFPNSDGKQPGDPAKAAAAILTALASDRPPLRLPLGNDATDAVIAHIAASHTETQTWEPLSRSTDFDA